ncbi:hypothetical protein Hanom_Chr10g00893571 [Helianthus anomalus]
MYMEINKGNLRICHLTNVLYENVTFMRPWMDSSTWEESVRHIEESMNEELTRVLSNVEESIPDASHALPDASHVEESVHGRMNVTFS